MFIARHLLLLLSFAAAHAGEAVPAPTPVPDEHAFLVVIIPDLRATLGRAEAIAERFSPGLLKPGALSAQLGAALGDPGLANLAGRPLVIAVGPGVPTPSIALLLPGKDARLYLDAAAQRGLVMGTVVDGLAVVAQTPDGQELGERVAAAYAALTAQPLAGDLRILAAPDRLVATYGAFVAGMARVATQRMPQAPGGPNLARILGLELAVVTAVFGDLTAVQVDLDLAGGGKVGLDELFAAKPGSDLAAALAAPAAVAGKRVASRFGAAPALLAMSGRCDFRAQFAYFAALLARLQATPDGKAVITPALIDQVKSFQLPWTGDFAMRLRSTEQLPLLSEGVYATSGSAQTRAALERLMGLFTGDSALAKLYQDMGFAMTFSRDVRAIGAVPVDRIATVIDASKLPADQVDAMKAMVRDTEVAVGPDWMAGSQDPKALDALVAGAGPGLAIRAEKTIGAGRQIYLDAEVIGFLRAELRLLGAKAPPPMRQALDGLSPGEPIAAALTVGDDRAHAELRLPLTPFVDMAKAFRAQRKAQAQAQPPADPNSGF